MKAKTSSDFLGFGNIFLGAFPAHRNYAQRKVVVELRLNHLGQFCMAFFYGIVVGGFTVVIYRSNIGPVIQQ